MSPRKAHLPPFVAIGRHTLRVPEWRTGLSSSEKIVYLHLKNKFTGENNGELVFPYSELLDIFLAPYMEQQKQPTKPTNKTKKEKKQ